MVLWWGPINCFCPGARRGLSPPLIWKLDLLLRPRLWTIWTNPAPSCTGFQTCWLSFFVFSVFENPFCVSHMDFVWWTSFNLASSCFHRNVAQHYFCHHDASSHHHLSNRVRHSGITTMRHGGHCPPPYWSSAPQVPQICKSCYWKGHSMSIQPIAQLDPLRFPSNFAQSFINFRK